jgi:hypothetical protein
MSGMDDSNIGLNKGIRVELDDNSMIKGLNNNSIDTSIIHNQYLKKKVTAETDEKQLLEKIVRKFKSEQRFFESLGDLS